MTVCASVVGWATCKLASARLWGSRWNSRYQWSQEEYRWIPFEKRVWLHCTWRGSDGSRKSHRHDNGPQGQGTPYHIDSCKPSFVVTVSKYSDLETKCYETCSLLVFTASQYVLSTVIWSRDPDRSLETGRSWSWSRSWNPWSYSTILVLGLVSSDLSFQFNLFVT